MAADGLHGGATTTVVGKAPHHWVYHHQDKLIDLSRPKAPEYALPSASSAMHVKTTGHTIVVSPLSSALIIVDMQNMFLSPSLGIDPNSTGNQARETLKKVTIPAARAAGMRVIWLNWGITDEQLEEMPGNILRIFDFRLSPMQEMSTGAGTRTETGKLPLPKVHGLGNEMGPVQLEDGSIIECGKLGFVDQWNTALPPDLQRLYEEGLKLNPPDICIHKNRMSGMWGASTPLSDFVEKEAIKTLFFTGVNTDRCVGGTLQDAFSRGYDCVMIKDGCATSSPDFAQQSWEFNSSDLFGFLTTSQDLLDAAQEMAKK